MDGTVLSSFILWKLMILSLLKLSLLSILVTSGVTSLLFNLVQAILLLGGFTISHERSMIVLKGKVWSKRKLPRLVLCVKDRQSAIFLKA